MSVPTFLPDADTIAHNSRAGPGKTAKCELLPSASLATSRRHQDEIRYRPPRP